MRRLLLLSLFLLGATRAARAVTCGGFSIVPSDHVLVKYSAGLATGATHSVPAVSVMGTEVTVTRNVSGGSSTVESCVDDMADLGYLGAGRFNVTWNDNVNLTTRRSRHRHGRHDLRSPARSHGPVRPARGECVFAESCGRLPVRQ
jgi:hypothetical protein